MEKNIKCEECEFVTNRKDKLHQHIRSKHMEKNIKCEECNFVTDRKGALKTPVQS